MFWPELSQFSPSGNEFIGVLFALVATGVASLGSMVATHNQRMPVVQLNGFAMMYGAVFVAVYTALSGSRFAFDWPQPGQ